MSLGLLSVLLCSSALAGEFKRAITLDTGALSQPGFTALGMSLSAASLGFAVGGARLALDTVADATSQETRDLFTAGVAAALPGLVVFDIAVVVAQAEGSQVFFESGGPVFAGMGVAAAITGNLLLAGSAKEARKDLKRVRGRASAIVPTPWLAVADGGAQLGVAFAW